MPFVRSAGTRIYYDDRGAGEPVLVCLPGWCVHHTIYGPLADRLGVTNRVLVPDWRGHGDSEASDRDFGYQDMVADVLAVIEAAGARSVVPIAQAHGGWVAVELLRRLGERVSKLVLISWNPIITSNNPEAAPMLSAGQGLQSDALWGALQDEAGWKDAADGLVDAWVKAAPADVEAQIRDETGAHGLEDWARAGREIAAMFRREGDPLMALGRIGGRMSVLHLYSQPRAADFLAAQEAFARAHPWFTVTRLDGVSHFPQLELTDGTAGAISEFIAQETAGNSLTRAADH
jgi:pimeloyl-ACP methyl ester carboxylesterase